MDDIDRFIDCNTLKILLRKKLKRAVNVFKNPAYPPMPIFTILLLQRWYNLTDVDAKESLYSQMLNALSKCSNGDTDSFGRATW
ncbi:hypothetical protein [Solidesulfovibrio aerotolerans]|uniref:hypothetical protein n=1 Tax=Solidesulfovibrio aerotolerans TaxID=295255 RepID=UPI00147871E2|nr:hypothetical protein [Solidesulfovibrio aerotolerans]